MKLSKAKESITHLFVCSTTFFPPREMDDCNKQEWCENFLLSFGNFGALFFCFLLCDFLPEGRNDNFVF